MSDELKQLSDAYKQACDQYPMLDLVCELRTYTEAKDAEITRLTAELAAMRERCERLRCLALTHESPKVRGPTGGGNDYRLLTLNACRAACREHNDLTPPKETSDGQ